MYTFELFDESTTITITNVENYFEALSKFNLLTGEHLWNEYDETCVVLRDEI